MSVLIWLLQVRAVAEQRADDAAKKPPEPGSGEMPKPILGPLPTGAPPVTLPLPPPRPAGLPVPAALPPPPVMSRPAAPPQVRKDPSACMHACLALAGAWHFSMMCADICRLCMYAMCKGG